MLLDFKEIPRANSAEGLQDTFELFARDFLEALGYGILVEPNRGADGKCDMIVQETRKGVGGVSKIKWLVSCKHYAHSAKSVGDKDEPNITDRIKRHRCNGFMGFYSTILSPTLSANLEAFKDEIHVFIFDPARIEKKLLSSVRGRELASRYFSSSYTKYLRNHPVPSKLHKKRSPLKCENCGKNIFGKKVGIWVGLTLRGKSKEKNGKTQTHDAYFSCKGKCDYILKHKYHAQGYDDRGWLEVSHFKSPIGFLYEVFDYLDRMEFYDTHPAAQEKFKRVLLEAAPFVMREPTDHEESSPFFV